MKEVYETRFSTIHWWVNRNRCISLNDFDEVNANTENSYFNLKLQAWIGYDIRIGQVFILVTRLCEVECLEYRFLLEQRVCKLTTLLNPIFTWFCRKANLTGRKQTKFGKSTLDILKDIIATHAVQCSNISKIHYLSDDWWTHCMSSSFETVFCI